MLSAIVAIGNNNEIGLNNELIYSSKRDMDRFVEKTTGKIVLMGYNTWKSLKRPFLKGRENVVVVKDRESIPLDLKKAILDVDNPEQLRWISEEELMASIPNMRKQETEFVVMGGAHIYEITYPYLDKIYISIFNKESEADRFFPPINWNLWNFTYSLNREDGILFIDMER